ncbi:hypothetical protein L484_004639 [Morus notabilis]|uniref:Uncharacterized protein n=1 Tax=Morus notabilis TaxID=981085 RepID=W9S6D7_9ROSA|nr:hypothetical protein L484_004639 [Morus notabilis]
MATEDDSIDQAVAARRERLKALKAAQELLNTPDEDSVQVEDKKNSDNDSREETVNPKWVIYHSLVSTDREYMRNE